MGDSPEPFGPLEPALLVASCAPDGGIVFANEAWRRFFGGDAAWDALAPEDREQAVRCVEEAGGGHLVTHQIFPVRVGDRDEPVPVLLHFYPVYGAEAPTEVCAVAVSGEVLAEPSSWTISQTQRARLETLGRMAMGIAHDFNNLLSGILGYTELLKTFDRKERLSHAFDDHLATIERAALDGAALVRKIQQYLRQEKETRFEPVDLPGLIQDCVLLTRPYWYNEPRRQGIEIELELDLEEVPPVLGSAPELREVIVNLVLNAVQAMPEGGTLTLATACGPAGVQFSIRDTGLGMSETVRRRIFEPLFTTKGEHGTGMGLAVSYGIVQEHDGRIEVASKLSRGTAFTLTFPPAEDAAAPEDAAPAPPPARALHLLIVDDEQMVRTVLSKLLRLRGHTVTTAASGPEALRLVGDDAAFDVVIVDKAMPEMDGRELARRLRRRFPTLPILLLTGDTDVGTPDDTIDVILAKPFQIDEVEATIQELIG